MAIIRMKELRKMSEKELDEKLSELRKELINARTKIASKVNPDNPGKIKEIKKTIARILMLKGEKKIK
ncbi:MAG: 50S ribosomal protein L29 [Candidatus Parvarchaeota archaeon]|nr:50S ribosomal protein L29 [Candidatus Jingweiarchaeum tengchongense]MCW1297798.1 50S ribosomal protein L29 [Candidatus Jingweiarchaeum tengchongense]MCW1299808.1 50S ribosomal protein L29 [Candidatus Jingweiarchaeum tengchongense]MCW1304221.1 50S ribosomal protein L29 [Candidatus Jingweiarchaeum tengchongense]MCW1305249.1 50S ribosomal protein L29 [Candidatus Jingweiarchaeum tengchongense]